MIQSDVSFKFRGGGRGLLGEKGRRKGMKVKLGRRKVKNQKRCVGGMADIQGRIVFVFLLFQGKPK